MYYFSSPPPRAAPQPLRNCLIAKNMKPACMRAFKHRRGKHHIELLMRTRDSLPPEVSSTNHTCERSGKRKLCLENECAQNNVRNNATVQRLISAYVIFSNNVNISAKPILQQSKTGSHMCGYSGMICHYYADIRPRAHAPVLFTQAARIVSCLCGTHS